MFGFEKQLETEEIYSGKILNLRRDKVLLPSGNCSFREVVEHRPAVCILAEIHPGTVLFVRQHRYPVQKAVVELPAGVVEPGEDPLETAHRELREEVHYDARSMELVMQFYSSPGYCDEKLFLFHARDLVHAPLEGDDDETILVEEWSEETIRTALEEGLLEDGKTLLALYWYLARQKG